MIVWWLVGLCNCCYMCLGYFVNDVVFLLLLLEKCLSRWRCLF